MPRRLPPLPQRGRHLFFGHDLHVAVVHLAVDHGVRVQPQRLHAQRLAAELPLLARSSSPVEVVAVAKLEVAVAKLELAQVVERFSHLGLRGPRPVGALTGALVEEGVPLLDLGAAEAIRPVHGLKRVVLLIHERG